VKLLRRFGLVLADQFLQGLSARDVALTLAIGFCLSVPPMLGVTTLFCTVGAIVLRLNQPVIQAVNILAYPLQLAFLVPFLRAGEWLFRAPHTPLSPAKIVAMGRVDLVATVAALWTVTWHGMVVWAILSWPAGFLIYRLSRPGLQRLALRARKADVSDVA